MRETSPYFRKCPEGCDQHEFHSLGTTPVDEHGRPLDTKGNPILSCVESVTDGSRMMSFHTCGRKLKGDPEFPHLCGLHVAAIKRGRSREVQRQEIKKQREAELQAASAELEALNTRLGITSVIQTSFVTKGPEAWTSKPTGNAIVPVEKLQELADRLSDLETRMTDAGLVP